MAKGRFVEEYRKGAVNGASPLQLVIMLYDGALRFMEGGKAAIIAKDLDKQNYNLQKAQRIIAELISCLDINQGGEIARNLLALYTFVTEELVNANLHDDPNRVAVCIRIMTDLRSTWTELESSLRAPVEAAEIQAVETQVAA